MYKVGKEYLGRRTPRIISESISIKRDLRNRTNTESRLVHLECYIGLMEYWFFPRDHWKEDKLKSHYPVIMPGYKLANCDESEIDEKYFCCVCGLLLRDVMQTYCGHLFCFSCLGNLRYGNFIKIKIWNTHRLLTRQHDNSLICSQGHDELQMWAVMSKSW